MRISSISPLPPLSTDFADQPIDHARSNPPDAIRPPTARPPTLLHCIANGWRVFCRLIVAWRLIFDGYSTACHSVTACRNVASDRTCTHKPNPLAGVVISRELYRRLLSERTVACMSEHCRKRWVRRDASSANPASLLLLPPCVTC